MKLRIKYIGLSAILFSAVFVFGKLDTHNEQFVESPKINNISSELVSDYHIPTENKLTQQDKEVSYRNPIEVPVVDEDKGPVQLLPIYMKEDTPRIKLLPSK
ncbi:hypothetical protein B9T62_22640 [Paenibacillus donghaensis]|uniref:Uncharacterized protein n=2 Tax=Paenibacillus donghaensis TaxID=414771 RepID=A0A2Z2K9J8_9BACL|nr:hypothetical protein B9T62_22640 [Paenibacillus donghaensis]